jgi:hypothetical protein
VERQTNSGTSNKQWDVKQMVGRRINGRTTNEQQQDPTLATNARRWGCYFFFFFFVLFFFFQVATLHHCEQLLAGRLCLYFIPHT